ncbi:MAG TPA: Lsr2 family protein [Nitrolancea sp.]|nr:Lsr2 family protein [Nitrolancea sp.]
MARETVVILKDDIDGSEAVESITFSIRGHSYEIDLNEKNVAAFERSFAKWIAVARRTSRARTTTRGRNAGAGDARAIRVWAAENGVKISERGRIPRDIIEQYRARR